MREGRITSLGERGMDEGDGRYHLTFSSDNRHFRFYDRLDGKIIQRLGIDFGVSPMPLPPVSPGR